MEAHRPEDLQFNLRALRSGDAKRMFRQQIIDRDGACVYCGSQDHLTLDHVKPKCRGGQYDASNLVAACRECNRSKGSSDVLDWFLGQPFFSTSTLQSLPL